MLFVLEKYWEKCGIKTLKTIFVLAATLFYSHLPVVASDAGRMHEENNTALRSKIANKTYNEIVLQNLEPGISPSYDFPSSFGRLNNGCFAYAVKNIVEYKYGKKIDSHYAVKKINKLSKDRWTYEHMKNFLNLYNIEIDYFVDAETFFLNLINGEPLLIQYKYYGNNDRWQGHLVVAYSFDAKGVYVAESINGKRERLDFSQIFDESGGYTQFSFGIIKQK